MTHCAPAVQRLLISVPSVPDDKGCVAAFENSDAEMRAAGAWAREALLEEPQQVVAIVTSQLERDSERAARLVREALAPGWQVAGQPHMAAVNVSYGKRLNAYPAIAVALHWLRWLHEDINSSEVSLLLRSAACGDGEMGERSRLDIESAASAGYALVSRALLEVICPDWRQTKSRRLAGKGKDLAGFRENLPARETPSQWADRINEVLGRLNWPGKSALNSFEFQLVNRWRELLNDLARLELVSQSMSLGNVLLRLHAMASETVFQPESEGAVVQLLGPLEAAGMQFDRLWVGGLSSANWPPAGRPSPLVSRQLQRDFSMPDAEPADTLAYASRVLRRLAASADTLACSYPLADGDVEQSPAGLIDKPGETRCRVGR